MSVEHSDDRRKDFRTDVNVCVSVDVPLALSYQSIASQEQQVDQTQWDDLAIAPDLIRAMIDEKDLTIKDPLLLQMLTRVDWLLTSVLKTLNKDKGFQSGTPQFLRVNLSGSGIRFRSEEKFSVDDSLVLRLILRPFIPIQAIGKVLRVSPAKGCDSVLFETAVEFVEMAEEDREAIVRHILRSQATIQRHRQSQIHGVALG